MAEKLSESITASVPTDINLEKGNLTPSTDNHSIDDTDNPVKLNSDAFKSDESDGKVNWTITHRIAAFSLCFLYVGSQIPLYFVGASLQYIIDDVGGTDKESWLPVANTLAIAATAPFVGYMQDLVGRRYIALLGCILLIVGVVLVGTAHEIGRAIGGMALAGVGAGIGELTALAGISEIVPVNKRGIYLAVATGCIIPFSPYILYAQYWSFYATWRWGMWITAIINGVAFFGTLFFYFPKRTRHALSRSEILKRVDYIGAILSIVGLTLFLVALQCGGYTHPWKSAYVLSQLLVGFALMVAFVAWEWKGAKYPMVPHEIFAGQRIVGVAFLIAFISGMNFYSMLNFYPILLENVYTNTPHAVGLKSLGIGFATPIGATLVNWLLSVFKGHNRELLLFSCVLMTAFAGSLASINPDTPAKTIAFGSVAGFGIGGVLIPAATIAITVTPDAFIATTVALSLSIRVIGGSIGYSIYYNIFSNKLRAKLPEYIALAAIKAGLPLTSAKQFVLALLTDPKTIFTVAGITPEILAASSKAAQWAYSASLAYVWYTSIAFGVLSIVACLFLGQVRPYLTHRIAVELA